MSVINKMLRDLDSRAGGSDVSSASGSGVASVPVMPDRQPMRRATAPRWQWLVLPLAVGALAGLVWWTAVSGPRASGAIEAVSAPVGAPVAQATAAIAASVLASQPAQGGSAPAAVAQSNPVAVPLLLAPQVVVPQQAPASQALAPVAAPAQAPVRAVVMAPAPPMAAAASSRSESAAAAAPSSAVDARTVALSWQDAAQDAVAQAQRLWAGGARDAAIELAADALAGIERVHGAEMSGAGSGAVLALLRELVRMEMVQGQHAAVLAVLKRYERAAAAQADLWAVRANAAQRLGQHAESVQGYQTALRLRPAEPRWMLGAAVSMAAQGQTVAAAEMAEQARSITVVSPEVLAYLRQAGVVLRDR